MLQASFFKEISPQDTLGTFTKRMRSTNVAAKSMRHVTHPMWNGQCTLGHVTQHLRHDYITMWRSASHTKRKEKTMWP